MSGKRQRKSNQEDHDQEDIGLEPFTEPEDEEEGGPLQQDVLDELYGLPVRGKAGAGGGPAAAKGSKAKGGTTGRTLGRPPGSKNKFRGSDEYQAAATAVKQTSLGSKKVKITNLSSCLCWGQAIMKWNLPY